MAHYTGVAVRGKLDDNNPPVGMLVALCRAFIKPMRGRIVLEPPRIAPNRELELTPDHPRLVAIAVMRVAVEGSDGKWWRGKRVGVTIEAVVRGWLRPSWSVLMGRNETRSRGNAESH